MDSKLDKLTKQAEKLGIELDANETIADLEAKIAVAKTNKKENTKQATVRRQPVKHINFTRRIDREAKDNG
jgi:hypothetical protein